MTVRLALLGCGAAARRLHLPALRASGRADVVAFASATRGSAEAAAAEWGGGMVLDDWRKAIELPAIDGVDICAPNAMHAEMAIAAAEAGKHVLVEKPIARTLEEADAMIAAAARAGVVLSVAHNARYDPAIRSMRAAIAAGRIGEVTSFRAALRTAGPAAWEPRATWFFDPMLAGGGALLDLGVHVADVVRFLTASEADAVSAMTMPAGDPIDLAAHVVLRTVGGAIGTLDVAWNASLPEVSLAVGGTEGALCMDDRTSAALFLASGESQELSPEPEDNPYAAFARAIAGGKLPAVRGEDGRAALAIVRAAYQAAATGNTVSVESGT